MGGRSKALVFAAVLNTMVVGGAATLYVVQSTAREDRIKMMLSRLESCKDEKLLESGCYEEQRRIMLEKSAKMYEAGKQYEQAGLIYVELGDLKGARRVIGICEKNENGSSADKIKRALEERASAFERFGRAPPPEKEEPEEKKEKPKPAPSS